MHKLFAKSYDAISLFLADIFENERLQRMSSKALMIALDTAIRISIVVLIFSILISVGPTLETRFLGVYTTWKASNFRLDEKNNWEFDVFAVKPWYKGSCLYLQDRTVDAVAFPPTGSANDIIRGTMHPDGKGRLYTAPDGQGQNYSGHWIFRTDQDVPVGSIISGTIQHQCHFLWISTTILGPFQIKIDSPTPSEDKSPS